MRMTRRLLLTTDQGFTTPKGFELCCDDCGGLCRDLVELLSPKERGALISNFKATRLQQISSGELQRLVAGERS